MATFKPCSVQGGLLVSFTSNVRTPSISSVNKDCNPAWVEEVNGPSFENSSFEEFYSLSEEEHDEKIQSDEACQNLPSIHSGEGCQEANANVEELIVKLQDALQEAAKARREAQLETEKRRKAEVAAIKAIHRFKESEAAFKEAAKQKEDASSLLRITKHWCEEAAKGRDEAMKELETTGGNLRLLEGAWRKIAALKEQNHQILQEKDSATTQLQRYLDSRSGMDSSSSKNLKFSEYSWEKIKAVTCDFSDRFKLGEGRYGTVYRGEIEETSVAVKILREEDLPSRQKFQHEMYLLTEIRHPHLVHIVGFCSERGCIIYEYMCNGSLADRLSCKDATPPLPWHARIRIAAEICYALQYLHSLRPDPVVHRDLKPQNILLDENYLSKISDFGIARILPEDNSRETAEIRGIFSYMDPEYLRTGEFSIKSDVYSMEVIILQILTGKPAFGLVKEVENAMVSGKLKEVLDPSAGEWPSIQTTQLAYFALHCTESDKNKRTALDPDVMKLMDDLRNFAVAASNPSRLVERSQTSVHIAQEPHKPTFFVCPIFKEVMENPYVAADSFTYEKEAIEGWFGSGHDTSPMTNLKVDNMKLIPNHSLRSAIRQWQEKGDFMHLMDVSE